MKGQNGLVGSTHWAGFAAQMGMGGRQHSLLEF